MFYCHTSSSAEVCLTTPSPAPSDHVLTLHNLSQNASNLPDFLNHLLLHSYWKMYMYFSFNPSNIYLSWAAPSPPITLVSLPPVSPSHWRSSPNTSYCKLFNFFQLYHFSPKWFSLLCLKPPRSWWSWNWCSSGLSSDFVYHSYSNVVYLYCTSL